MIYHFVYKTTHINGKYYIGRHSTKNLDDGYFGSGKWIRSIKDKSKLFRTILEFCDSLEDLLEKERKFILEHIDKENCMNFNNNSVGFSTGELNPSCSEESRKRNSVRVFGENNPSKRPEVREKMSNAQKGRARGKWKQPMSAQGRRNISAGKTGIKYSDEGRKKLSESRKRDYANGTRIPARGMLGKKHSEETKIKQRKPKEIIICPNCGKSGGSSAMKRWHFDNCKKLKENV